MIQVLKSKALWLFNIEHSRSVYLADFAVYFLAVIALFIYLTMHTTRPWLAAVLVIFGLMSWTLLEYGLHRFVLHHLSPFKQWHAEHHLRPKAFICTSTFVSMGALFILIDMPLLFLTTPFIANAYTLGLLIGYLSYAVTHHAIHHWQTKNIWLLNRIKSHGLHHALSRNAHFGVTTDFWDKVFSIGTQPNESK